MKDIHPLKRKSIKPSSSTVRGMLPGPQFRALDAAMQSMRSAGLRLEWNWKSKDIGWVCSGLVESQTVCELRPTDEPLLGVVEMTHDFKSVVIASRAFPKKFKAILENPMAELKKTVRYEFPLETTDMRDMMSEFVEGLVPFYEADQAAQASSAQAAAL